MLVQHHHPIPPSLSPPLPSEDAYNPYMSSTSIAPMKVGVTNSQTSLPSTASIAEPNFTIRRATVKDAPAIAHLGATVFSTTFGFSIPSNDLKAFLNESYTVEAIEEDIRCPTKHIFVACRKSKSRTAALDNSESSGSSTDSINTEGSESIDDDDEDANDNDGTEDDIIGFTQLTEATTERCVPSTVELQRLYVSTSHHSKGVGKQLAHTIGSLARDLGYKALWLGVWEGNFKAQLMYEGLGYRKVGDHEFKIGRCIQMDWIMCKKL
ncbi:hypothetical protein H2200_000733 [Cladophialophora chaetospira]|uniref:N-acetyltransferase domain-containing protein n=1 Tax=Cladophialophora chaetospira TaxID=386627 RepID=A0AA38XP42_9EURO|nr:hypothetical protein H2200_000733 [Cladophialophora chaetospira]